MALLKVTILSFGDASESLSQGIRDLSKAVTVDVTNLTERSNSIRTIEKGSDDNNRSLCCIFADELTSPLMWQDCVKNRKKAGELVLLFLSSSKAKNNKFVPKTISQIDHKCILFIFPEDEFLVIADALKSLISMERTRKQTDGAVDWNDVMTIFGSGGLGHVISIRNLTEIESGQFFVNELQRLSIKPATATGAFIMMSNENFSPKNMREHMKLLRSYCLLSATIALSFQFANFAPTSVTIFLILPIS